ncbi:MAG: GspH/FimT family pseudopilin [Magnetococcus sp. DMHC-8]
MCQNARGFTLLEMLITVAILAVVLSLSVPHVRAFLEIQRLKNSVETIAGDLQYARLESVKRNQPVSVTFATNGTHTWSYSVSPALWSTKSSTDFFGVYLTSVTFAGQSVTFNPVRGTANAGQVRLATSNGTTQLAVNLGILGQVSTCYLTSIPVGGYPPC